MSRFNAALFDLGGVIFDTEPQYTRFWKGEFHRYYPDRTGHQIPDFTDALDLLGLQD